MSHAEAGIGSPPVVPREPAPARTPEPSPPASDATASPIGPWLWLGAVLLAALATAVGIAVALDAPELFAVLDRPGRGTAARRLLVGGATAIAVLAVIVGTVAARVLRTRGAGALRPASVTLLLRLSAYLGIGVLAAMHLGDPFGRLAEWPMVAAALGAIAWLSSLLLLAGVLIARPRWLAAPVRRLARAADVVAFNVLAVAAALEVALAVIPLLSDSPLLQFDPIFASADVRRADETLRRFRLRPQVPYYDGSTNSRGYVDDEFFAAEQDDLVVAVISDSFGVGIVPPRHNFVAEIERRLQGALAGRFGRVAAHNFGVSATGLPEYHRILETEALATRPALVVLCVFVGNDLFRPLRPPGLASFAVLRNWRTFQLAVRLDRLAVERGWPWFARSRRSALPGRLPARGAFDEDESKSRRPRPLFLAIERQRLEVCNTASRRTALEYRGVRQALERIRRTAHGDLLVALIPDEFQVNDALWSELLATTESPETYDRNYPQRRLLSVCDDLGIAALDLLPPLTEAQLTGPTYRLNDTHWTRLGNAVAGGAIADAILRSHVP